MKAVGPEELQILVPGRMPWYPIIHIQCFLYRKVVMDEQLSDLTDESITLELLVSELYLFFYTTFPEDAPFWWRMVEEERNHAALIRSARKYFAPVDQFPEKLVVQNFSLLRETNKKLRTLLKTCSKYPPTRRGALSTALELETSAGELHFQEFIDEKNLSAVEKIFQQLNGHDVEHADRIRIYMEQCERQ